jgi:hypothetical protein
VSSYEFRMWGIRKRDRQKPYQVIPERAGSCPAPESGFYLWVLLFCCFWVWLGCAWVSAVVARVVEGRLVACP